MLGAIVRFIVSAIVLLLISYIVPGLQVAGFTGALIAALVIAGIGWVIEMAFGKEKITRMHRGVIGFLTAAVIIYASQFVVPAAINVSIIGALLAALVIGVIDGVVPTELK
ncbi:MAG: phage holin family protein [Peptococcaceae bacterium]|nr:phage holin family protein [Peptococcaceae bacterium]